MMLRKVSGLDIWYHMAIGREIVNTHAIPATEFLVFPNRDQPGEFHEWGFGVVTYLVQRIAGYSGLSWFTAGLIGAYWAIAAAAVPLNRAKLIPAFLIAIAVLILGTSFRGNLRPELFLYLVLAAELVCLERYQSTQDRKWLYAIPLLSLLLAQFHPSAIILIYVAGAYWTGFVWCSYRESGRIPGRLMLAGVGLAVCMIIASAVNPYGFAQLLLPLQFAAENRDFLTQLTEFFPIYQTDLLYAYVAICTVSVASIWTVKSNRLAYLLLLAAFAYLAYEHSRNLALLALVMFPVTAQAALVWVDYLITRLQWVGVVICWAIGLIAIPTAALQTIDFDEYGAGADLSYFPQKIAAAYPELGIGGTVFNFYDYGGYLAWQWNRHDAVFIDGRQFKANRARSDYLAIQTAQPGWKQRLNRYDVNAVILPATMQPDGRYIDLIGSLSRSSEWQLLMVEERGMLFVRVAALPEQLQAMLLPDEMVWQQVIREASRFILQAGGSSEAYRTRGIAWFFLKQKEKAKLDLQIYQRSNPGDTSVQAFLNHM